MKILFLTFLLIPTIARSGVVLHIGPSVFGGYKSEAEAPNGKDSVDAKGTLGYGFGAEFSLIKSFLTFDIGVFYGKNEAKSQYYDRKTNIRAADQLSYTSHTGVQLGLKLRPVNFNYWNIFVGGGGTFGHTKLRHDSEDYIENQGPLPSGFKDKENVQMSGYYLESGTEIIFSKTSGLRLVGQLMNIQSGRYETLNNKLIKTTYPIFGLHYIHYIDKIK